MTDNTDRKRRRRIVAAIIAGAATLGVVGASAASLGGITSNSLGADTAVVGSCDTDGVTLAYTNAYDATLGRYQTTSVNVTGINAACAGKTLSLTLKDSGWRVTRWRHRRLDRRHDRRGWPHCAGRQRQRRCWCGRRHQRLTGT